MATHFTSLGAQAPAAALGKRSLATVVRLLG